MNWLDKLERKYGRYCLSQLMTYVVAAQAIIWVYVMFINRNLLYLLTLSRSALLSGQLWRLLTFIAVPPLSKPLFLVITLYFYWFLGSCLEREWGSFRFNVYFLIGMLGAILGCLVTGSGSSEGLFLSLFFAFAWLYPDMQVLILFVLPIKVKWLGWLSLAMWGIDFVFASLPNKVSLLLGVAGFLVFFGRDLWHRGRDGYVNQKRRRQWNDQWKGR